MKDRINANTILEPSRDRRAPPTHIGALRTEHALRASEIRYRRLFETAKDGILILDAGSGKIIDANPYLADLLGYRRADFLGKHIWDFVPFKDVVASREAYRELQARDYIAYEDLPLETSDGRQVDVGFVSNVYLADGKRIIQCNIRDITARKSAEVARQRLEEQLRASQKMEAIGSLAGGIAHDFNNLLSVILGYTGFALDALADDSAVKEDLLEAEKAIGRACTLVGQLLAFSRKQVLDPVLLDLNGVILGLGEMLRRILGEDVELVHTLAPGLALTLADEGQIEQVLMNLVINSRDAMPHGGRLTIATENVELDEAFAASHLGTQPGSYVMLAVTDTGNGMDAQTRARVFEPFFTTKGMGKGTGLGLSTVYGIVKQSGGHIWVYSVPGHGTRFKIYLPREAAGVAAKPSTETSKVARPPHGGETLLVVEDEEAVRNIAHRILIGAGYRVMCAANGRDALRMLETYDQPLPLVLTDVVMPQLGGRAFAAELRRLRPETLVLFMSGYSDDVDHRDGFEPGARFIAKPFKALDLLLEVRAMLDEARVAVPAEAT